MKRARLMVTLDCERDCEYCVNKDQDIMALAKPVTLSGLSLFADYGEIMITGGEPALVPRTTLRVISRLREVTTAKVFIYTARMSRHVDSFVAWADGLTYTIHSKWAPDDLLGLRFLQESIDSYPPRKEKTFRLSLSPDINVPLPIIPRCWDEVRIKVWKRAEDLVVPEHGELYLLKEEPCESGGKS